MSTITAEKINAALTDLHRRLSAEIEACMARMDVVMTRVDMLAAKVDALSGKVDTTVIEQTQSNQLAIRNETAVLRQELGQLVVAAAEKSEQRVLTVIDKQVLPKINNAIQWVAYSTQDGSQVVDEYRRGVAKVAGGQQFGNMTRVFND